MLVAAGLLAGSSLLPARPAQAAGFSEAFQAKAAASGIRYTLVVPKGSVTDTAADVGAPTTEALLDFLGESRAFASYPYPGDTPANLPGLLRGLAKIPAPAYPFYAASFHPSTPEAQAGLGPYLLRAESGPSESKAIAAVGYHDDLAGSAARMESTALALAEAQGVTAAATSLITGFSAGPLKLGEVVSSAEVVMAPGGALTREADTHVVGAKVGETPVVVTEEGVQVADSKNPGPDTAAVNEALAEAGLTVTTTDSQQTPVGVIAPAIRVSYRTADQRSAVWELGGASASVRGADETDGAVQTTQHGRVSESVTPTRAGLASALADGGNLQPVYELGLAGVAAVSSAVGARTLFRRRRS